MNNYAYSSAVWPAVYVVLNGLAMYVTLLVALPLWMDRSRQASTLIDRRPDPSVSPPFTPGSTRPPFRSVRSTRSQPPCGVDDSQGFRVGGSEKVHEIVGRPDFWSQSRPTGVRSFNHRLEPIKSVGRRNRKRCGEPGFATRRSGKIENVPPRERAGPIADLLDDDFWRRFEGYVAPAIMFGGEARRRLQMRTQEADLTPPARTRTSDNGPAIEIFRLWLSRPGFGRA